MTFYTYMNRKYRDDKGEKGEFVKEMKKESWRFPKNGVCKHAAWHKIIANHVKANGMNEKVFEECWEEYMNCVKKKSNTNL